MIKNILHIKTTGFAIILTLFAWFKTEWFDAVIYKEFTVLHVLIILIGVLILIPDTFVNALKKLVTKKSENL